MKVTVTTPDPVDTVTLEMTYLEAQALARFLHDPTKEASSGNAWRNGVRDIYYGLANGGVTR